MSKAEASVLAGQAARRVQGSESFQRINFLLQAAIAIYPQSPALSRYYIRTMRDVAEKTVLRLDPGVKAHFCRRCSSLLSFTRREVRKGQKGKTYVVIKCPECQSERRSRLRPDL